MASPSAASQPEHRSGALLDHLARRMRLRAESVLAPLGLRPRHLVALTVLRDRGGKTIASAKVSSLKAPVDLLPKTATVAIALPPHADWKGGSVTIETSGDLPEITLKNNRVQF